MTSYDEMKKVMKQVSSEINEREVAVQQIQKLHQHRSVREYITEFQTISSNLDWDEGARAQRIDREHWNQRERNFRTDESFLHVAKRDRYGDIQMIEAKVDLENLSEKQGLCFNSGRKGHQARWCRQTRKEAKLKENPVVAGMVRLEGVHTKGL
jgi:Retrotransposon gag protein